MTPVPRHMGTALVGGRPITLHYTGHKGGGLLHVVVDHHGIGDLDPHTLHLRPLLEAPDDVGLVVPTGP